MTETQYQILKSEIEIIHDQLKGLRSWLLWITIAVAGTGGAQSLISAFGGK